MNEGDFWKQPCEGLKGRYAPVPDDTMHAKARELGIIFPVPYVRLMQQQNGGDVRRSCYYDGNQYYSLFINSGKLEPLEAVRNFTSVLLDFMSADEIEQAKNAEKPFYPERLIIISELDGHGLVCLDYGYLQNTPVPTPAVVVFEQDFNARFEYGEVLRVPSFERFVEGLVYHGYGCEKYFMGVSTPMFASIDELSTALSEVLGAPLNRFEDDHHGWFDFSRYYAGSTESLHKPLVLYVILSPNQHRSGTSLFQNKPAINYIISVEPRKDHGAVHEDITQSVKLIATGLEQQTNCTTELLLCPHPFSY